MTRSMALIVGTMFVTTAAWFGALPLTIQAAQRNGVFTVSGTLVRDSGVPVSDARVIIAPLVAGDSPDVYASRVSVRVEDGRLVLGAGEGRTASNGRFQIRVQRGEFDGPVILFAVLVALQATEKPQEIMEEATRKPRAFQIGEATENVDLGRIVVQGR